MGRRKPPNLVGTWRHYSNHFGLLFHRISLVIAAHNYLFAHTDIFYCFLLKCKV